MGSLKAGCDARPTTANLAGQASVTARSAVLGIRFEVGARAPTTCFAGAAAAAIKGAAAAVGRTAAFPGLARQRRAADPTVADLARSTGGIAGSTVRRVSHDIGARAAAAGLRSGAVDAGGPVRATGGAARSRPAVPAGVAASTAVRRVAERWLSDTVSVLAGLARCTSGRAASTVRGIGLEVGASAAAATLRAGAVDTGSPCCTTGGSAGPWPAVAVSVTATLAVGWPALSRRGDAGAVLTHHAHVFAGMAGMVGPADEARAAAICIAATTACVADAFAESVTGRAFSDAGAVGADVRFATLATRGASAADWHATAGVDDTGPILTCLIRATAGDRCTSAAQATFVAAAGAERIAASPRLVRFRTGIETFVTGRPRRQVGATAFAVCGVSPTTADQSDDARSGQTRDSSQHTTA
jgi:hypothetical protein